MMTFKTIYHFSKFPPPQGRGIQQERMIMSMRKAINEKCKDCIYDPESGLGTWRQQISDCTMPDCALYPYRPLSEPYKAANPAPKRVMSEKQRIALAKNFNLKTVE